MRSKDDVKLQFRTFSPLNVGFWSTMFLDCTNSVFSGEIVDRVDNMLGDFSTVCAVTPCR